MEEQGSDALVLSLAAVRRMLEESFTPETLIVFCYYSPLFQRVVNQFGRNSGLEAMVQVLIDYCRTQGLFPELLDEFEKVNPRRFGEHKDRLYVKAATPPHERPIVEPPPDPPQQSGARSSKTINVGDRTTVLGPIVQADGDVKVNVDRATSAQPEARRAAVRLVALVIGGLGLVVGALWLAKAGPVLTPEFALALVPVVVALSIGVVGLLMPGWLDRLFGGRGR